MIEISPEKDVIETIPPIDDAAHRKPQPIYVVQKHVASSLHYDFRLELDGTLKSWAIPKGPSLDPAQKRLAIRVEDHSLSYADFEGVIPPGQYGAGRVVIWDQGTWEPIANPQAGLENGALEFVLHGDKLKGGWVLVRLRGKPGHKQNAWLLIKRQDAYARPHDEFDVIAHSPGTNNDAQ